MAAYTGDKGRVYENTEIACVYNVADPATEQLVRDADVVEGCRAVGFTLGVPGLCMLGVVDDVLADRAFVAERRTSAAELGTLDDVRRSAAAGDRWPRTTSRTRWRPRRWPGPTACPPVAVRDGLRGLRRDAAPASLGWPSADGVTWVDDSKATNPHAAAASLAAFEPVVWVAGGLAKGAALRRPRRQRTRSRLRAAVLIGRDRDLIAEALARHAPDVPVVEVDVADTGPVASSMDAVVGPRAPRAGPPRGHRAARPGVRLDGPVRLLRRSAATRSRPPSGGACAGLAAVGGGLTRGRPHRPDRRLRRPRASGYRGPVAGAARRERCRGARPADRLVGPAGLAAGRLLPRARLHRRAGRASAW